MSIGGIQTYIRNLIPVLRECGYGVSIYQRSTESFQKTFDDCTVYGVVHDRNICPQTAEALLNAAIPHINTHEDILLYGCETCITRKAPIRTIAIQHGISWDVPKNEDASFLKFLKQYLRKCLNAWSLCQRIRKVDQLVCVDHNFVNWYRAITPYPQVQHIVIPNFCANPSERPQKNSSPINIIFARRFFVHRGTRLFAHVAERLLKEFSDLRVTIAGAGPDETYLHNKLEPFSSVQFITYESLDSIKIHSDKDIAVIPTIGSEGTSLSLLEAMAAGCAVVCTNVGGMTNIVLDGYNGLMIPPEEEALYQALKKLIEDQDLRARIQKQAYQTVKDAFSIHIWQEKWKQVIMTATSHA